MTRVESTVSSVQKKPYSFFPSVLRELPVENCTSLSPNQSKWRTHGAQDITAVHNGSWLLLTIKPRRDDHETWWVLDKTSPWFLSIVSATQSRRSQQRNVNMICICNLATLSALGKCSGRTFCKWGCGCCRCNKHFWWTQALIHGILLDEVSLTCDRPVF